MEAYSGAIDGSGVGPAATVLWPKDALQGANTGSGGISIRLDASRQALVVRKALPGFSAETAAALRELVREVAGGRRGPIKFLAVEFAHDSFALSTAGEGFDALVDEFANLILTAPVITIAWARADLAGADLEFALACSMLIAERGRRFSFAGDPTVSLGVYGLLAMRLGFVQAERLMESADIIDAERLHELLLIKEVGGPDLLNELLDRTARRHNSSCGIYRAQRMNVRAAQRNLRA